MVDPCEIPVVGGAPVLRKHYWRISYQNKIALFALKNVLVTCPGYLALGDRGATDNVS